MKSCIFRFLTQIIFAVSLFFTSCVDSGNFNPVDLGLSVEWADCNVGALSPEGFGHYLAFGETEPKSFYSVLNYSGSDSIVNSFDKGGWRIPTREEYEELIYGCDWICTSQNGVKGYKVVGPNGNSIFLPFAGYYQGQSLMLQSLAGLFWVNEHHYYNVGIFLCSPSRTELGEDTPYYGLTVRLVRD